MKHFQHLSGICCIPRIIRSTKLLHIDFGDHIAVNAVNKVQLHLFATFLEAFVRSQHSELIRVGIDGYLSSVIPTDMDVPDAVNILNRTTNIR